MTNLRLQVSQDGEPYVARPIFACSVVKSLPTTP